MEEYLESEIVKIMVKRLCDKLDEIFIEGLRKVGFEFKNEFELIEFIKINCYCEDKPFIGQKTYFVNKIPFLIYHYKQNPEIINNDVGIEIFANLGQYSYL